MSLSSEGNSDLNGQSREKGASQSSGPVSDIRRHLPLIWRGMIVVYLLLMAGLVRIVAQLGPLAG